MNLARLASTLLLFSGLMLCVAATTMVSGEPRCKMTIEYTGDLSDQTWVPNSEECSGSCTTSGACELTDTSDDDNVLAWECRCPSGGGYNGCREVSTYERISPEDPWVHKGFSCAGEETCPAGEVCDYSDAGGTGDPTVRLATCMCQI